MLSDPRCYLQLPNLKSLELDQAALERGARIRESLISSVLSEDLAG